MISPCHRTTLSLRHCASLAIALVILCLYSSSLFAQQANYFNVVFDSANFGAAFYGGTSYGTLSATNITDVPKTITGIDFIGGDSLAFTGSGNQFPLTLNSGESVKINISFKPVDQIPAKGDCFHTTASLRSSDQVNGTSPAVEITAVAYATTEVSTINPFDRITALPMLKFSGSDDIFSQIFRFACTDTSSLKVIAIELEDAETGFVLTRLGACSGLPMVALPGDLMAVRVSLQTKDLNMHRNRLRFVLGNGMPPIVYDVAAMRVAPVATVKTISSQDFNCSAIPNPSSRNMTFEVSGKDKADMEIYNQLGIRIASEKNASTWNWNGQDHSGTPVPSGNYFLLATTRNSQGQLIATTKQVVIIR